MDIDWDNLLVSKKTIHRAAYFGKLRRVKKLLASDPSLLDSKDSNGDTPLHNAAINGQLETVRYLLEFGAMVDVKNDEGMTPLIGASWYGDSTAKPGEDLTGGNPAIVELLIKAGATVNTRDVHGYTPIHCANREVIDLLLANGHQLNPITKHGHTPLDVCLTNSDDRQEEAAHLKCLGAKTGKELE